MVNKMKTWVKIVLSVVLVILFQMNIDINVLPDESFYTKDRVFDLFLFVIFYYSFQIWENKKEKYKRWSLIIAGLLAGFYIFGYNIEKYLDVFTEYNHNCIMGKLFLKWLGCWYCFSALLLLIYAKLDNLKQIDIIKNISKTKRYLILVLLFVIFWFPSLLNNFPGIIYGDSWNQIYQALGMENLTTHHPIIHTLFLKGCFVLCHDIKKGILLYTIVSFTSIIAILAGIINLMIEEDFDLRIIIITACIYMFFPSIPMLAITITKDSWFAAFVGLFLVELYILLINRKWGMLHGVGLVIASLGVGLFRKNGIYLLIFTIIYIAVYMVIKRVKLGKILIICTFAVCFNICIEKGTICFLSVDPGSPREMLSLPIQQMARIEKNIQNLDPKIKTEIDSFFKKEGDLGEAYYPLISDNAKDMFSEEDYYGREKDFLTLSIRLLFVYTEESLEAFMCNSFGYWYPIAINWFYMENNTTNLDIKDVVARHEYPLNVDYIYFDEFKNMTGLASFCSIGIIFWIFIIVSGYLAANRKYEKITLMVPVGALWLTSVASPVYNELRYVLSIYIVFPVICQLIFGNTVEQSR